MSAQLSLALYLPLEGRQIAVLYSINVLLERGFGEREGYVSASGFACMVGSKAKSVLGVGSRLLALGCSL